MSWVLTLAVAIFVIWIIVDPKYDLFVHWRKWHNDKFIENYDVLFEEWNRLDKQFQEILDKYHKRCNQTDKDTEEEMVMRYIETCLSSSAQALSVALNLYPRSFPIFWRRYPIYELLIQIDVVLEICNTAQEYYKEKYTQKRS